MRRLPRIIPSILTDDPKALLSMVREAEAFAGYVQFDIMDGHFVPSRSITSRDLTAIPIHFAWEAHLMVERPEDYMAGFKEVGAKKVIFHYEAQSPAKSVIMRARKLGLGVGLAVNPETRVSTFIDFVDEVDSVVFLTVRPGYYGNQFVPEVLEKVVELRRNRPLAEIGVDGGVKEGNIVDIVRDGVDLLYVGSEIFLKPKPADNYHRLVSLLDEHETDGL